MKPGNIELLRTLMSEAELSGILAFQQDNIRYISGYRPGGHVQKSMGTFLPNAGVTGSSTPYTGRMPFCSHKARQRVNPKVLQRSAIGAVSQPIVFKREMTSGRCPTALLKL